MEVLVLRARSQRYLWHNDVVFSCRGFETWGADIGCSSSAAAEGSIAVITDCAFANDFSVAVAGLLLDLYLDRGR